MLLPGLHDAHIHIFGIVEPDVCSLRSQPMTLAEMVPYLQACIERWRRHMDYFWTPNLEQLLGLADLYNDDPRFKANFDKVHPDLAEFMRAAIGVYVENRRK